MRSSVMIVGGAGYIGTEVVRSLADRGGVDITVVDLCWFGSHLPETVKLRKVDAWTLTPADMQGFDAVLFLGGLANDEMCELSPSENFSDNAALPTYLAYIARQSEVSRFIFASSCAVYGDVVDRDALEIDLARPTHPYGIAKCQAEAGLMRLATERFRVYCMRKGTVSGWSERMRFDLVLNTMTRDALARRRIFVRGPMLWRPILSVSDAASAYCSLLLQESNSSITSGIYNVAAANYTLGSLADAVSTVLRKHGCNVEAQIEPAQNTRTCRMDLAKSKKYLPSLPKHTAEDIVEELYARMNTQDPSNFIGERFSNIQVYRRLLGGRRKGGA
jgi:nucleoside-diphosphate-sugar epimerase